ncbi:tyrosine-type recombinase/integrase [Pseudoalteromonas sp. SR45-4]|uniref:tyrosine-type recombinase/integrase n=1 Tax=Pseudoalteromonas sp. SR45-4 TaxID=2760929 RepID=UPI0015FE28A9|nr:tyrosine-type recombinase/integrase [Pseudoalteromonas sp. SR45-4]MBB1371971.1 tyrosine-type recombinase/integrase [Pseudoalteromonas sp. SR45-4]
MSHSVSKSEAQRTVTEYKASTGLLREEIVCDLNDDAQDFVKSKHAPKTQLAYKSDARIFTEWCYLQNPSINPLHCKTADICNFLAMQAKGNLSRWQWVDKKKGQGTLVNGKPLAFSSVSRRFSGVKFALSQLGRKFSKAETEVVADTLAGIANRVSTQPSKVKGFGPDELRLIFSEMNLNDHVDLRDRALLMLLFAGAFRRSELASLKHKNIKFIQNKGMDIKIEKVKRNRNGITKSIVAGDSDLCPVRFMQEYIDAAGIFNGYVFRRSNRSRKMLLDNISDLSIYKIVVNRFKKANIDGRFGGHSGRRGFVDTSLRAGKPINKVMEMTGHKDLRTVQEYFDETERWKDNAGSGLY